MNECPFCSGKTGYETKAVSRLITWLDWEGEAVNTEIDWISGGKECRCMDCGKVVTKYIKDGE